ncbi:uncharacterized protein SCODWIG_00976 [Saccharomycodes ludwigii]|uniref:RNA polymerase II subunit A C-terminal domain phosphatase n=1 Tax=Saccharomycodes ludwigii TaxID=36035 RepID=A0A376B3E8_9ASCO|nr:uncharacterized protein SCODWIG_00976 [Saccharomycodes ludwigii]
MSTTATDNWITEQVYLPTTFPTSAKIVKLYINVNDEINKGDRILAYQYTDEEDYLISSDDLSNTKKRKVDRVAIFESPAMGKVTKIMCKIGDSMDQLSCSNGSNARPILELQNGCSHQMLYGGLCVRCGKVFDPENVPNIDTSATFSNGLLSANGSSSSTTKSAGALNNKTNLMAISHSNLDIKVTGSEAANIADQHTRQLLKQRKLILVVDLDQTVIHCAVDPTIGEWQNDPSNPNYDMLQDVKSFILQESPLILPSTSTNALVLNHAYKRECKYYVKMRPGLQKFFQEISQYFELHIYTMATRAYALEIAKIIDPDGKLFADRILSRDENGSLTHKSLERLFPTDQSMVLVIDDRGDVWNWCENLIKVVPYNFFVGIGDINSTFLPNNNIIDNSVQRSNAVASKDKGKEIEEKEKKLREETANGLGTTLIPEALQTSEIQNISREIQDEEQFKLDKMIKEARLLPATAPTLSDLEDLDDTENNGGTSSAVPSMDTEKVGKDNTDAVIGEIERSAVIEVQHEDRPLAEIQKRLDIENKRQKDSNISDNDNNNGTNNKNNGNIDNRLVKVLSDNDVELEYLGPRLVDIHHNFYDLYNKDDNSSLPRPDLKLLVPALKRKVFETCHFVFSGIFPLGVDLHKVDIVIWCETFGATITDDITLKTTHLITKKPSTLKARLADKYKPDGIKIVHPDWIFDCLLHWSKVDETPYKLKVDGIPVSSEEYATFLTNLNKYGNTHTHGINEEEGQEQEEEELKYLLNDENKDWLDDDDDKMDEFLNSDDEEEEEQGEEEEEEEEEGEEEEEEEKGNNENRMNNGGSNNKRKIEEEERSKYNGNNLNGTASPKRVKFLISKNNANDIIDNENKDSKNTKTNSTKTDVNHVNKAVNNGTDTISVDTADKVDDNLEHNNHNNVSSEEDKDLEDLEAELLLELEE